MASKDTTKILQEEPYVKVATREIAILVQEVQNSQKEKKDLKERCLNLEYYINNMRPARYYSKETATVTQGAFFPPTFNLASYSRPEVVEATGAKSSNLVDNDLEEDSLSVTEVFTEPDRPSFTEPQNSAVYEYPEIDERSPESDFIHPTILSSYPEQFVPKHKFYGVSQNSFNMALTELAKCKKSNAELTKMTEKVPRNRKEWNHLEEKLRQVEKENAALENKLKTLERNVTDTAQTDIINTLQRKIFQQERQSSLRNLAFDQLNKQCDKWRRKYEEMSQEFGQLAKQIYSRQDKVVRDAPLFPEELSGISKSSSTPNFTQLLNIKESLETDVVMYDQVEGESKDQNLSEMNDREAEKNANVNVLVEDVHSNFSDVNTFDNDRQDIKLLDNVSGVNLDNVSENQTTSGTTASTIHGFLKNLNARNEVSTQIDSRAFGENKYVQTDDNNNVIDEQTQTEEKIVTNDVKDNRGPTELIFDLKSQNDILNNQYERMREENTMLKSCLDDKDDSSVAKELANSMKQLNFQCFSVYETKDNLRKMIERKCEDFRRQSPERVYSIPSSISETKSTHTIQLSSRQITVLSELSADFNNLNSKSGVFQREYRSCPDYF